MGPESALAAGHTSSRESRLARQGKHLQSLVAKAAVLRERLTSLEHRVLGELPPMNEDSRRHPEVEPVRSAANQIDVSIDLLDELLESCGSVVNSLEGL